MGEIRTSAEIEADLLYPLRVFYERVGRALPECERVEGMRMPEPIRQLLVHENDMTPTLERHHGCEVGLRVMERFEDGEGYYRQVVLVRDSDGQPVEFGAIRIALALYRPGAQALIREGILPLGHILREHAVEHRSQPRGYFCIEADEWIAFALGMERGESLVLFGRRNVLVNHAGAVLADVVEILPPMAQGIEETVQ